MAEKSIWPLLFLTAVLHAYFGLSSVAYVIMGLPNAPSGLGGLTSATAGGLQSLAAAAVFVYAGPHDLRGATLAIAWAIALGWFSVLPSTIALGLDFQRDDRLAQAYFVVSPFIAVIGAWLAWRNIYPIAAVFIVTATTVAGVLFVIAFGIMIAMYGF